MFYYFFTPIVVFKIARFCQRKIFKQNLGFENVGKRVDTPVLLFQHKAIFNFF